MKLTASLALLLSVSSAFAAGSAATAYTALRLVGKQSGAGALNRVLEIRGRNGAPQPAVWKVVLREPDARGGVREVEVQRGKIIGERTPVARGPVGEPMDFSRLNLDSEGAFTLVEQEAAKKGVRFDRIDYALRSGSGGGAPVWTIELFDGPRGMVGTMLLAADTGAVLEQSGLTAAREDVSGDRDYVNGNPPPPPPVVYEDVPRGRDRNRTYSDGRYSQPGEHFRGIGDFFHRLGNRVARRGEHLENFITGKRGGRVDDR